MGRNTKHAVAIHQIRVRRRARARASGLGGACDDDRLASPFRSTILNAGWLVAVDHAGDRPSLRIAGSKADRWAETSCGLASRAGGVWRTSPAGRARAADATDQRLVAIFDASDFQNADYWIFVRRRKFATRLRNWLSQVRGLVETDHSVADQICHFRTSAGSPICACGRKPVIRFIFSRPLMGMVGGGLVNNFVWNKPWRGLRGSFAAPTPSKPRHPAAADKFTVTRPVPPADRQHRHRHDHPKQFLKTIARTGAGRAVLPRCAAPGTVRKNRALRAQQAGHRKAGSQWRATISAAAPRASTPRGRSRLRHPLRHLPELRRHLLQQLLQERHPAIKVSPEDLKKLMDDAERPSTSPAHRRSGSAGDVQPITAASVTWALVRRAAVPTSQVPD